MKTQSLFNGLQLLLLAFISYKLITLESQLSKNQELQNTPNKVATPQSPSANEARVLQPTSNNQIEADIIRAIVADELDLALSQIQIPSQESRNSSISNHYSVDDNAIAEINNQMIGYMSDGIISELELKNIERSMATMNHAERQKVIQILAKNATNYSAIITH